MAILVSRGVARQLQPRRSPALQALGQRVRGAERGDEVAFFAAWTHGSGRHIGNEIPACVLEAGLAQAERALRAAPCEHRGEVAIHANEHELQGGAVLWASPVVAVPPASIPVSGLVAGPHDHVQVYSLRLLHARLRRRPFELDDQVERRPAIDARVRAAALRNTVVRDADARTTWTFEEEALPQPAAREKELILQPAPAAGAAPPPHSVVVVIERRLMLRRPGRVVGLVEAQLEIERVNWAASVARRPPGAPNQASGDGLRESRAHP